MASPQQRPMRVDQNFEVMKQMQMDRMNFTTSLTCHERCVKNYYFNNFYFRENTCMRNCLEKMNQVSIITNLNLDSFEKNERSHAAQPTRAPKKSLTF